MAYLIELITDAGEVSGGSGTARIRPRALRGAATAAGALLLGNLSLVLHDSAQAADTLKQGGVHTASQQLDTATAADHLRIHRRAKLTSAATASEVVGGVVRRAVVRSTATAAGAVKPGRVRGAALHDAGRASERAINHRRFKLASALTAAGTVRLGVNHVRSVFNAAAQAGSASAGYARVRSVFHAGAQARSSLPLGRLHARSVARSIAEAEGGTVERFGGEVWVTNTRSGAASYWLSVPANGATVWRDRIVVSGTDGISALDSYNTVSTVLWTAWRDFGDEHNKRVAGVYLDGGLDDMRVTAAAGGLGGTEMSGNYPVTKYTVGMARSIPGRGLYGRYWRFCLTGLTQFNVRSMSVDVGAGTRRA